MCPFVSSSNVAASLSRLGLVDNKKVKTLVHDLQEKFHQSCARAPESVLLRVVCDEDKQMKIGLEEATRTHGEAADVDNKLKHEQLLAQELEQRLAESEQESALLRQQKEELRLQASMASLQELKYEQSRAQELEQRLEESKQENALLRQQKEELQASMASLQEMLVADIEYMESTMAAGGDNSV